MGRSFDGGLAPTESQAAAEMLREIDGLKRRLACERTRIAQLQQAEIDARHQVEHLEIALAGARRIGAAMGVLMATHHITDDQAFALLRTASQHHHRKVRDIADEVVLTGELPTVVAPAPTADGGVRPSPPAYRSRAGVPARPQLQR
jgi:ANTAR domain